MFFVYLFFTNSKKRNTARNYEITSSLYLVKAAEIVESFLDALSTYYTLKVQSNRVKEGEKYIVLQSNQGQF